MDSNRVRLTGIRETSLGVLPGTPRMRRMRFTGEGLKYRPEFVTSDEIRDDRMNADPIRVGNANDGPINFEWSFFQDLTLGSELMSSAFLDPWLVTPYRDNDGTADSVITDVNAGTQTVTVTAVAPADGAFVVGHLGRFTGFGNAANNGKFRCSTGHATAPVFLGSGLVNETAPAAGARIKVVGFQGASGDITAAAGGLGSTALNFTTLGIRKGMKVKIGDADNAVFQFGNVPANNGWARVSGDPTATFLPLDNLPSGWGVDNGAAKTIRVFFGDSLKNGVTLRSLSLERSFLSQGVPTHILQRGMAVNRLTGEWRAKQKLTGAFEMLGTRGSQGTVANGNSYDAATTNRVMAGSAHVGQIYENGTRLTDPNWARSLSWTLDNHLRTIDAMDDENAVGLGIGECEITGRTEAYFGSNVMLAKLLTGTPSSMNARAQIDNQAIAIDFPRVTFTDGVPSAEGKSQDLFTPLDWRASIDPVMGCQVMFDRLEYFN